MIVFELLPCTVADVENIHFLMLFQNAIDHPINMRLIAIKQVPEVFAFGCGRAALRVDF
jgi:hypothetical protein